MNPKYQNRAHGFGRAPRLRLSAGGRGLQLLLALALAGLAVSKAQALDPTQPPGRNFDLSHWYLTLPEPGAPIIEPTNLVVGYTHASWFYTGPDGAMVFWCPVTGGTTANSSFPRSELRERLDPAVNAVNWTVVGTHILDAECRVTQLPSTKKVIIGQIHGYLGAARPLLKLVFDNGVIDAQVKVSPDADPDAHIAFVNTPLNSTITYQIKLVDGLLTLTVNGISRTANILQNDPAWANQTFYFKAGSYVQDNSGSSSEGGRVAFYKLKVQHSVPGPTAPSITSQPASQNLNVGATASFNVAADGTPPLSVQWRKDGVEIPGATGGTLNLANVQTNDAGNYSAVVTNVSGAVTSAVAALAVTVFVPGGVRSLAEAVDAPGLTWTTNGSPAWFVQTNVTHDGADAAQSGAIADGGATTMQTTVIGPGTLSFWWKVSSEKKKDTLSFLLGGKPSASISAEVDWQRLAFSVPSGTQALQWTYVKNSSKSAGLDRGWVDQVIFIPNNTPTAPIIEVQPLSQAVAEQTTAAFSVLASGSTPLSYQWQWNGTNLYNGSGVSGALTAALKLTGVPPTQAGAYTVVISNAAGSVTSAVAQLTVFTLADALDNTAFTWLTSGPLPWSGQTGVTRDGADAARSGIISKGQTTLLQTTVTGPGALSFWWKVSSKVNKDFAVFSVGGSEQARLSGEVDWQRQTFSIPPGSQVVQWSYTKGGSSAGGSDSAWVDEVQFVRSDVLPKALDVAEAIQRANDHYIATSTFQSNGWARGVYQTGNMRAYDVLHLDHYRQFAVTWGEYFHWQPGFRGPASADGQVCGQTYFDLFLLGPQPVRIAAVKAGIDARVAASAVDDWWWIDAFYMGGPVYARLSKLYGTNSYSEKMWRFYQDTKVRRGLFATQYGLWYRDEPAKSATTANGKKQIWGRGNGWVIAALARVLEQLPPNDPHRGEFITMLQTMAAALKPLQGADGMWRASLLDPAEVPNPETSSTALYTFALAWGVRHGYLDTATYRPVVARAWNGMTTLVLHPDGTVGYAQPQGREPAAATYDDFSDHGTGAFLLAGSEVYLLAQSSPVAPLPPILVKIQSAWTPAPVALGFSRFGGKMILSWAAAPGKTYQVLYKDRLTDAAWKPWTGNIVKDGSTLAVEDAAPEQPQRFYQVIEK